MQSRREVLVGGMCTLGVAAGGGCAVPEAPDPLAVGRTGAPARNVVFILTDDQRWNAIGALGSRLLATPNLDRLAREGARFAQAFVTTSLCCPSRASILTGLYAHAHGVLDNTAELDPAFPTYARILDRMGVDTAHIGKWHMGADNPHPRPGWKRWVGFRGQGRYVYPGTGPAIDRSFSYDGELREVTGYVTDLLTDEAVAYLDTRRPGEPFCLVVSHKAVHAPFVPAERHRTAFADAPDDAVPSVLPDTPEAYADLPFWFREMRHRTEFGVDRPYRDWPDFRSWYLDYHRTLLSVDDSVGQILAKLAERGLDDDTAVVFTSDNGFLFGEQGVLDKRNFYDPSIRVPLLVRAPGLVAPGTVVDAFALNVDLAPTLVELCGFSPPAHWHGRSLVPLLRGERPADWRQEFVYAYFFERTFPDTPTLFGIRTPRMKLTTYHGLSEPDQLFDLDADPDERTDVIDVPAYADRRKALKGRLAGHFAALGLLTEPVWGKNWVASGEHAARPAPPPEPRAKAKGKAKAGGVAGGEDDEVLPDAAGDAEPQQADAEVP